MTPHPQNRSPFDDTITIGTKSWDALWEESLPARDICPKGQGWRTATEIAKSRGIGECAAHNQLKRLWRQGVFERAFFKSSSGSRPSFYYRPILKNQPKKK